MNDIIFRSIRNINMEDIEYDIENTNNINIVIEDIADVLNVRNVQEAIPSNIVNISHNVGWDTRETGNVVIENLTNPTVSTNSIDTMNPTDVTDAMILAGTGRRCICRYNNFKLCDHNITNSSLYCRYHKNTKIGYIHKIFYNVFKDKEEITVCDLYMLYKYINSNFVFEYIKELYTDLLKHTPFKLLLNIAEKNHIISNNRKYSKKEIYSRLYNINKNTYELENNHINMEKVCKIQRILKERFGKIIKSKIRDRLRDNIFNLEDYKLGVAKGDYMNCEELFTGENICDIPPKRLYILCNNNNKNADERSNERSEKYIFDAVELEYFVRKCKENKQDPYNPYNRDKLDDDFLENLYIFIKYNDLVIKNYEYLWENNMHAFTELSLEIERRGFYNSPEWFERLKDADFLKVIKYFKLFSANTPESNKYFNKIRADTLVFDFCKDAIKMFIECNDEYYILCCNFIKAMALCSNNFYNNLPAWLLANGTGGIAGIAGSRGTVGPMGIGAIIDNIRINTNLEALAGAMNRNNASELANNFLLYYYVEYI